MTPTLPRGPRAQTETGQKLPSKSMHARRRNYSKRICKHNRININGSIKQSRIYSRPREGESTRLAIQVMRNLRSKAGDSKHAKPAGTCRRSPSPTVFLGCGGAHKNGSAAGASTNQALFGANGFRPRWISHLLRRHSLSIRFLRLRRQAVSLKLWHRLARRYCCYST
eukprot:474120-Amphidinium_carterae.2